MECVDADIIATYDRGQCLADNKFESNRIMSDELKKYVDVVPATALDRAFTYAVPDAYEGLWQIGSYVTVPMAGRSVEGIIWNEADASGIPASKIKAIKKLYENIPVMSSEQRAFLGKVAAWTMSPLGNVLDMALGSKKVFEEPKRQKKKPLSTGGIPDQAVDLNAGHEVLNKEQKLAADSLIASMRDGAGDVFLLDGVTGSGKTEVYFDAMATALSQGDQVLLMMPEIALSNSFVARFERRFGFAPALWHSEQTPAKKRDIWKGVAEGKVQAVIGARSSLFLPFKNLKLLVVDEEHDGSYKQEEVVIYNARDMAVLKAKTSGCTTCLVSATPSLETVLNVQQGRYKECRLTERYGEANLPDIELIDMRVAAPATGKFISEQMIDEVRDTMDAGQQAMLFLNRRGYAPMTLCKSCGHRLECPQCTAWLVEHKQSGRTFCHHCGYGGRTPKECPSCQSEESLIPVGPGVERIAEEIQEAFPEIEPLILTSDTVETSEHMQDVLTKIHNGDVQLIIGTQIIAKGHHFPDLTFVGVIDADLGAADNDLRAGEKSWQLLQQVSGRAGRGDKKGKVLLQTYNPHSALLTALQDHDRDEFIELELSQREMAGMPPYGRIVTLTTSSVKEGDALKLARELAKLAPVSDRVKVLGPAAPPLAMLRGRYRYRLMVICDKKLDIQKVIKSWVDMVQIPHAVRLHIDIDPLSFM